MKTKLLVLLTAVALLFGCAGYDDTGIKSDINNLKSRVAALEQLCKNMNENITALQTLVTAIQKNDFIINVADLPNNAGYTVTLSSGKTIYLYNGTDGADGHTPVIGVRMDTDGDYYWTIDGEWITSNGKKMRVSGSDGNDGNTPKLKIDGGMWYVSYDNENSWVKLGKATGEDGTSAGIISVTEDDSNVYFEMKDGSVISVPKKSALSISFSSNCIAITEPGATRSIDYTLSGASEEVIVKTIVQNGWKAKVEQKQFDSGTITITAPNPLVESEIIILVNDKGVTVLGILNCITSEIKMSQEKYDIDAKGGLMEVPVQTNADFKVVIPDGATAWLSYVQTKSMIDKTICFSVAPNNSSEGRNAIVSLTNADGYEIRTFLIAQSGDMTELVSVHVDTKGSLHSVLDKYDKSTIVKLKISGVLNDVDFLDMYLEMPGLRYLDISDVNINTLPNKCFYQSDIETILLPSMLNTIGSECFDSSHLKEVSFGINSQLKQIRNKAFYGTNLTTVTIPATCEAIESAAFSDCRSLENVAFESGSQLKSIGSYAFSDCRSLENVAFESGSQLKSIGICAFTGTCLKSISIPNNCEIIDDSAFSDCRSLENVAFESGSQLKSIGICAFTGTCLKSIIIPNNCETIDPGAFDHCQMLEYVSFESNSKLKTIGGAGDNGAFSNCTALKYITIPASCETIGIAAFYACVSLESVTFEPNSQLKTIDGSEKHVNIGAFSNCTSLKSITIPSTCEKIGAYAFFKCSSLAEISFGFDSKLKEIRQSAFSNCALMGKICMENCKMLSAIQSYAFSGNGEINLFQIGASVPPYASNPIFDSIGQYSVLKVPAGSESAYGRKSPWSNFSSITALD